jgi:hypothetical protein
MLQGVRLFSVLVPALLLAVASPASHASLQSRRGRRRAGAAAPARTSGVGLSAGIGDQNPAMFSSGLWRQLRTGISRYIAPYDAAARPDELAKARAWIQAALAAHQQILIAFYHSEHTPTRMPSVSVYRRDVQRFVHLFPHVHEYQPWNEANRGNVRGAFSSPSAIVAADYYRALRGVAGRDAVVGLDVLDQPDVRPTLRYIAQFKAEVHRLHVPMPHLWGLHNYSDTNRFSSFRTRAILAVLGGHVWLTETGGVVKFGRAFPNVRGSGLWRAARALRFMFGLARGNRRIDRLYIFQWSGSSPHARFDAGLTDIHRRPRPGYVAVCDYMLRSSRRCRVSVSLH